MAHTPPTDVGLSANGPTVSSSQSAPTLNVWHARKEHMARTQPQPSAAPTPSNSAPTHLAPLSTSGANTAAAATPAASSNGISRTPSQADDPFVVRYHRMPPAVPMVTQAPLSVTDPESWPEVGASVPPTPTNGANGDGADKKEGATPPSAVNGSRKSASNPKPEGRSFPLSIRC